MSKCAFFFIWIFSLCVVFSKLSAINQNDLPEPYRSVKLLPFDSGGWYYNAKQIESIVRQRKVNTVIEVGSWLGLSTRHIATVLPPNGKVYAVDHWKGSEEHQAFPNIQIIYEQFLSNIILARLTHKIIPLRMGSVEAAEHLGPMMINPDLVYIDASHDTSSVLNDLNAWFPFVKGRGLLCGDDWTLSEGVRQAVEIFAREHHLTIQAYGNFWSLIEDGNFWTLD